jgi:bacterioferritin-associated ferredoxin
MKSTEKAIRDFCGHHADWWPSTTQVQEMLALAQPCQTCEALARTVMLDQTSHDTKRPWVGLTMLDMAELRQGGFHNITDEHFRAIEAKLKEKNT